MRSVVDFITSPVCFFRNMAKEDVDFSRAVVPVAIYVVFESAAPGVLGVRNIDDSAMPAIQVAAMLFGSITGAVISCALLLGSVLAINIMVFGVSLDHRRMLKCCGITYWSQVPWSIVNLVVVLSLEFPDLSGVSVESIARRVEQFEGSPAITTLRLVGVYFGLWLVTLHCCVLRALSGASVRSAWVVGVVLAAVFVVVPWVIRRF